ncbi:MAG: hypothetical protein WCG78_02120 [Candidatus Omnitrophota bacterium]
MSIKEKMKTARVIGVAAFNLTCLFCIIYVIGMTIEKRQAVSAEADAKVINTFEPVKKTADGPKAAPATQVQVGGKIIMVDDFNGDEVKNFLGNKTNVYVKAPSKVMIAKKDDTVNGLKTKVLMIKYEKQNAGGPGGTGGWCGYYTLLKNDKGEYLNGTDYKYITFWIKGVKGDENFMVGLADEHWDKIGDSLKSEEITSYIEGKKITTEWQKVKIPLSVFFLDHSTLSSISISFEGDCFPEGLGQGVVFISNIAIEK